MLLHEGQFNEPVLRDIEAYFDNSQSNVSGVVRVQLAPYNFQILGIKSDYDLMSPVFGSYGEMNNAWSGDDVRGFSKIASNQVMIHQKIQELAQSIQQADSSLYLGRGTSYPIALEGALKLKELSYIHAEGYPAGEMKHGPIALIDEAVPIIVLLPQDGWFEKTLSNMQEALARGAFVICLTDEALETRVRALSNKVQTFVVPTTDAFLAPVVYTIPLQLLAYHTALLRGSDVDQPRNLAKSVTVE